MSKANMNKGIKRDLTIKWNRWQVQNSPQVIHLTTETNDNVLVYNKGQISNG